MSRQQGPLPESLRHEDLLPVWRTIRARLDRYGIERRGRLTLPALSEHASLALSSLLDTRVGKQIDLETLEQALVRAGTGTDLDESLQRLGVGACEAQQSRRKALKVRRDLRNRVLATVETWQEPWAREWADWLFSSGQCARVTSEAALQTVAQVRQLVDAVGSTDESLARTELAVSVCGSSHALDDGVLLERCTRRALWHAQGRRLDFSDGRALWARAGVSTDRVSAPVMSWNLPLSLGSALGNLASSAREACVPLHLSAYALDRHAPTFDSHEPILLVENPRLVEAAAERQTPFCVIASNGNPTGAVLRLIDAILRGGIEIRHHGDFDSAGLAIIRRLHARGCRPWMMGAADYVQALERAAWLDLELPRDRHACGETTWDVELEQRFEPLRLQVHEELLINDLLNPDRWGE